MGLGLFIAKTLLERSGAEVVFTNATDTAPPADRRRPTGAVVIVTWPRARVSPEPDGARPG
jgi:two-component system sensor histidine kinase RegB